MGRRELLIALAFVVVGIVAYQFSAPPAKTAQGFSLSKLFTTARQHMQSDRAQATYTQKGTFIAGRGPNRYRVRTQGQLDGPRRRHRAVLRQADRAQG
jgi:hypothetical protein